MIKFIKLIVYVNFIRLIRLGKRILYKLLIRYYATPKQLQKAINKADELNRETGKRYRVFFLEMRYRVICREDMKDLKRSGFFVYHTNSTKLDNYKYYDTLNRKICI